MHRRAGNLFLFFLCVLGWNASVFSQAGEKRFFVLDEQNQVPYADNFFQDQLGFLWLGTGEGLVRFDGQNCKFFVHDKSDSTSISGNEIRAMGSSDGLNIWVCTTGGLNYFDREKQTFKKYLYDPEAENGIREDPLRCMWVDRDGNVWIGLKSKGLEKLDSRTGLFQHFSPGLERGQLPGGSISALFQDEKGRMWIGTEKNGLGCLVPGDSIFQRYGLADTMPDGSVISSNTIRSLDETTEGKILIGTSGGGLSIFDPEKRSFVHHRYDPDDPQSISSDEAYSVLEDSRGNIWVGTWARGLNLKPKGGDWERIPGNTALPFSFPGEVVLNIFEDRKGILWFGTQYNGLFWYDPRHDQFTWYQSKPGQENSLSRSNVLDILEVSEDSLWIGTYNKGLNLYNRRTGSFKHYQKDPGNPAALPNDGIWSLHRDRKGRIWVGTSRGLSLYRPGIDGFKTYGKDVDDPDGLSNNNVLCIAEDEQGRLWLGTWGGGMNMFDPETEKFKRYMHDEDDPLSIGGDAVKAIEVDSEGNVWAGSTDGISLLDQQTGTFTQFNSKTGKSADFSDDNVNVLLEVGEGRIWAGTSLGLYIFEHGKFRASKGSEELMEVPVTGILKGADGFIWISTDNGLFRMDPETEECIGFFQAEGIPVPSFKLWSQHAGASGHIYFGTAEGLLEFDPRELNTDRPTPELVLTDFFLNNRPVRPGATSVLDKNISLTESIELSHDDYLFSLEFSTLDFQLIDRIRYRYRLNGFDQNWIETDQFNRRATYTNVPHGTYTFEVRSAIGDAPWSERGLELEVVVLPPWWKTWWARSLFILSGILFVGTGFWLRIRSLQRQKKVLEEEVRNRTEEIRKQNSLLIEQKEIISTEKAKSESLLLNILPQKVAEELKNQQKATTRLHTNVSVLFLDFVGFTKISTELSAQELVEILDMFFVEFDRIVTRHGLEKIKTIGDAYMCAGGIPEERRDHCRAAVAAGLEMLAFVEETNKRFVAEGRREWLARVGVHAGEVIAGVVGEKKFAYDIWGDTVNTASRMESNGNVGEVNVSETVYKVVKDQFECVYKGKVNAKNKGMVDLYTVKGD